MSQPVPIAQIVTTAGTQVRSMLDLATVDDYAAAMEAGAEFPPVIVFHDGNRYYLADGFHRTMAAGRIGATEISADVRTGDAKAALWFAIGANARNGMRLSGTDKALAITKALREFPDRSQRQIAEHVGCNVSTVSRLSSQLLQTQQLPPRPERTIGKDGKSRPATRPAAVDTPAHIEPPAPAAPPPIAPPECNLVSLFWGVVSEHAANDKARTLAAWDRVRKMIEEA